MIGPLTYKRGPRINGGSHEISAPTISECRRGCRRAPGPVAPRAGADLSGTAGALIFGFAAGGATDILARLIGQWLSERLGQPFIIDNRPGAGGNIGTEASPTRRPTAIRSCWWRPQRGQRDALRKAQLQFHARHRAGRGLTRVPKSWRSIRRFRRRPSPSSSPTPRPIQARSTWPRPATAAPPTCRANCSRSWPASTWCTWPIAAWRPPLTDLLAGQVQVIFDSVPNSIGTSEPGGCARSPSPPRRAGGAARCADRERVRAGLRGERIATASARPAHAAGNHRDDQPGHQRRRSPTRGCRRGSPTRRHADSGLARRLRRLLAAEIEKWAKVIRTAHIKLE